MISFWIVFVLELSKMLLCGMKIKYAAFWMKDSPVSHAVFNTPLTTQVCLSSLQKSCIHMVEEKNISLYFFFALVWLFQLFTNEGTFSHLQIAEIKA